MNAPAPASARSTAQAIALDRGISVSRADISDIAAFRRLVFGHDPSAPLPDCEDDDEDSTWHIGLTGRPYPDHSDHRLIACVTYVFDPYAGPNGKEPAWRMRHLAALQSADVPSSRAALLESAERMVIADSGVHVFWTRAHILDRPLLEELGWSLVVRSLVPYAEGDRFLMLKRWKPGPDALS